MNVLEMQGKRRHKVNLLVDVLEVLRSEAYISLSRWRYKTYTSTHCLNPIAEKLLAAQLIMTVQADKRTLYSITPKGEEFLITFQRVRKELNSYGVDLL